MLYYRILLRTFAAFYSENEPTLYTQVPLKSVRVASVNFTTIYFTCSQIIKTRINYTQHQSNYGILLRFKIKTSSPNQSSLHSRLLFPPDSKLSFPLAALQKCDIHSVPLPHSPLFVRNQAPDINTQPHSTLARCGDKKGKSGKRIAVCEISRLARVPPAFRSAAVREKQTRPRREKQRVYASIHITKCVAGTRK